MPAHLVHDLIERLSDSSFDASPGHGVESIGGDDGPSLRGHLGVEARGLVTSDQDVAPEVRRGEGEHRPLVRRAPVPGTTLSTAKEFSRNRA